MCSGAYLAHSSVSITFFIIQLVMRTAIGGKVHVEDDFPMVQLWLHSSVLKGWETVEVPLRGDDGLSWRAKTDENRAPDTFPPRNNYS